jgi:ClpP class serine protease
MATSLEYVVSEIDRIENDPRFTEIVIYFDTPGGMVDGVNDAAEIIRSTSKKTIAMVGAQCCSAGYWLASACNSIQVTKTSEVGSIGVITSYTDWTEYDKNAGIREYTYTNESSPDKNFNPKKPDALIESLNTLADLFINTVAKNRKTTAENVVTNYGKGWFKIGQESVDVGMTDKIYNFFDSNNKLNNNIKGIIMADKTENQKLAEFDAVQDELVKKMEKMQKELPEEASRKELSRIRSIVELCQTGEELLLVKELLLDGTKTVNDASIVLLNNARSSASHFHAQYMADSKQVPVIVHNQAVEMSESEKIEQEARKKAGLK